MKRTHDPILVSKMIIKNSNMLKERRKKKHKVRLSKVNTSEESSEELQLRKASLFKRRQSPHNL